jgi:hypothetical protein
MKKSFLILVASTCMLGAVLTGCNSPSAQKVENAEEKVENAEQKTENAQQDLNAANEAYKADIEAYKSEQANRIAANNKAMADFKARKDYEKMMAKAEYKEKMAALEAKNADMQLKLDNFQDEGATKWDKFKEEFNHDMDAIGDGFKDLSKDNVK